MKTNLPGYIFWFDLETTGLNPYEHGIIQIAGLLDKDGETVDEIELFCDPRKIDPTEGPQWNKHKQQNYEKTLEEMKNSLTEQNIIDANDPQSWDEWMGNNLELFIEKNIGPPPTCREVKISPEALEVNHRTLEEIDLFPPPSEVKEDLEKWFQKNGLGYGVRAYPAGYNTRFDIDFLAQFWTQKPDSFLFYYIHPYDLDVYSLIRFSLIQEGLTKKDLQLDGLRLETLCSYFNIPIDNAHDALSDIKATRNLYIRISEFFHSDGVFKVFRS